MQRDDIIQIDPLDENLSEGKKRLVGSLVESVGANPEFALPAGETITVPNPKDKSQTVNIQFTRDLMSLEDEASVKNYFHVGVLAERQSKNVQVQFEGRIYKRATDKEVRVDHEKFDMHWTEFSTKAYETLKENITKKQEAANKVINKFAQGATAGIFKELLPPEMGSEVGKYLDKESAINASLVNRGALQGGKAELQAERERQANWKKENNSKNHLEEHKETLFGGKPKPRPPKPVETKIKSAKAEETSTWKPATPRKEQEVKEETPTWKPARPGGKS